MNTKNIVLCADDYGQAPCITNGILSLIDDARISATSCLVTSPFWEEHGSWLRKYTNQIDIGLHLNFTFGKPLSKEYREHIHTHFFSLPKVMAMSSFNLFVEAVLKEEIKAQIDSFAEVMGFLPNHIDGHQHVHHFPQIREALVSSYKEMGLKAYIRWVKPKLSPRETFFKNFIIRGMGSSSLRKLLVQQKIAHNDTFSGVYPFRKAKEYERWFRQFLLEISDGGIILCHPGLPGSVAKDPLFSIRYREFLFLKSAAFKKTCADFGIKIGRFKA